MLPSMLFQANAMPMPMQWHAIGMLMPYQYKANTKPMQSQCKASSPHLKAWFCVFAIARIQRKGLDKDADYDWKLDA